MTGGYAWLEERLAGRPWAAGEDFGMADCAAAPALFYADWVHQIGPRLPAPVRLSLTPNEAPPAYSDEGPSRSQGCLRKLALSI